MKYLKLNYIILLSIFTLQLTAQNWCLEEFEKIQYLQNESHAVIKNESKSLSKRIRESKKLAKEALKFAYKTIEQKDCENYSVIVDRIILLELQL